MAVSNTCVILFSGGQDSTTCLYWAIQRYTHVYPILFQYGQRHTVEVQQAEKILHRLQLKSYTVEIPIFSNLGGNALVSESPIQNNENMPNTFVPGRNLLFLNYAAVYAIHVGASDIVGGMCQTDYSGYPDCRREFIDSAEHTISLALDSPINIHTPLMYLDKAGAWLLAQELGILSVIIEDTHTCYMGVREVLYPWGYGCGKCPACQLRAQGYAKAFEI